MGEIEDAVRARYAGRALQMAKTATADDACCATSGAECCDAGSSITCGDAYSAEELKSMGLDAASSLGCGNPTLLADLHPGETVLDLGSGAGLDVLLSARRVSPGGHAYGVDMTDEMLAVARANKEKAKVANATFLKGTIEAVPLPDSSVDVIISNCVVNLAADKAAVLREAYRVLRPGGRLAIADMVALEELTSAAKHRLDLWAGCIAGTISRDAYAEALAGAGFADIGVETTRELGLPGVGRIASAYIRARKPYTRDVHRARARSQGGGAGGRDRGEHQGGEDVPEGIAPHIVVTRLALISHARGGASTLT